MIRPGNCRLRVCGVHRRLKRRSQRSDSVNRIHINIEGAANYRLTALKNQVAGQNNRVAFQVDFFGQIKRVG